MLLESFLLISTCFQLRAFPELKKKKNKHTNLFRLHFRLLLIFFPVHINYHFIRSRTVTSDYTCKTGLSSEVPLYLKDTTSLHTVSSY